MMYSTNFNGMTPEEILYPKFYIEKVQEFQRYLKDKPFNILEKDLLSLRPKRFGRFVLIFNTDRSMKFHETLRELKERVLSEEK